jgi:hypothetical protein
MINAFVMIDGKTPPLKAFRKLPSPGSHFQGGREVKDGETVLLTAEQARAFRDRFEPVDGSDYRSFSEQEVASFKTGSESEASAKEPVPPVPAAPPVPAGAPPAVPATHAQAVDVQAAKEREAEKK